MVTANRFTTDASKYLTDNILVAWVTEIPGGHFR